MLTKADMIDIMNQYIAPLYQIIGGFIALCIIVAAVLLVIKPFIRRI